MHLPNQLTSWLKSTRYQRGYYVIAWLCALGMLGFCAARIARIGIDLRQDFWVCWQNNRFYGDSESALYNGRFVLRQARALESADQDAMTPDQLATEPTIAEPGPGLFDAPLDVRSVWRRWQRLKPVYLHIFRGWVTAYDNLVRDQTDGDYVMDYPPLRSLVMTLWAWKVQAEYPSLQQLPRQPTTLFNPLTHQTQLVTADIIHPLLLCNTVADAASSIAMFWLVWIWAGRKDKPTGDLELNQRQWGDPLLLLAPISLGLFLLMRPWVTFVASGFERGSSVFDARITSVGWWIYLLLRFISVMALARFLPRPFRAVACGLLAATLVWINPASMLDSIGWPQWEVWLLPFFLLAAVLVSVNCWLTAGIVLAIGGMFKGQLYFVAPVLVLAPLFAGWFGRFLRMLIGVATGAGLVVWPWLVTNSHTESFIAACLFSAVLICGISPIRKPVGYEIRRLFQFARRRWMVRWNNSNAANETPEPATRSKLRWPLWSALAIVLLMAAILPLLIWRQQDPPLHKYTVILTLAILGIPWFLRWRTMAAWLIAVFAAALWLGAFSLGGSFSWWEVGFKYGTQKHNSMQLGNQSLSNLSSLLEQRYGWNLHDPVGTLQLPFLSNTDLDLQSALALVYGVGLVICCVGGGIHLRRGDRKFLATLVAPWMLFVTVLTQMAARYTLFPAVVAAVFVGLSLSLSLLQFLLMILSCIMIGNQLLMFDPTTAPVLASITRQTFPDMGWLTMGLSAVLLVVAFTPTRRPGASRASDRLGSI